MSSAVFASDRPRYGFDTVPPEQVLDEGPLGPEWGPSPTADQLEAAQRAGDRAVREAMRVATARALTREQAGRRIGMTPAQIADAAAAGNFLELVDDPQRRLPAWQFSCGRPLPDLDRLLEAWPGTSLALALWAEQPNVDLGGRTPADTLAQRHGTDSVLEIVRSLSALAW